MKKTKKTKKKTGLKESVNVFSGDYNAIDTRNIFRYSQIFNDRNMI